MSGPVARRGCLGLSTGPTSAQRSKFLRTAFTLGGFERGFPVLLRQTLITLYAKILRCIGRHRGRSARLGQKTAPAFAAADATAASLGEEGPASD